MLMTESLKKLDSVTFGSFLQDQRPLTQDPPTFDLRGYGLVTPAAVVQLAAICCGVSGQGRTPLILTEEGPARRYLVRCGFAAVVSEYARIEPAIGRLGTLGYQYRRGSSPMLVELTRIESGSALPELLDRVLWTLRYRLKYRKRDAFDVTTAVSEICQNTFDHNRGAAGFIAMQVYGKDTRRFLEVAVSDYGEGLGATLRRNPLNASVRTDMDAIQQATKLGTSEHDDPTRGTGLFHLLEITYKHEGTVQITSGRAKVRYRMDKRAGWGFSVPKVLGVHVSLTLPTKEAA